MENNECAICAERIDGITRLQAVGMCNHIGVCSLCYLRLRSLIQNFLCPICKTELENVVCSQNQSITYQDFSIWGENAGPGMRYDQKSRMFFPTEYYDTQITPLWSCKCSICDVWKRDIKSLSRHVSSDHENKYLMCSLCIENKKVFPSEQKIFTQAQYENHLKNGGEGGFEGHPKCEFCKKRYYDKDALFYHLQKDHYTCHICDKMGIRYRYYNNYDSLEAHYRSEHIICEEPECLLKKFVVFADPIDHAAHMLSVHPNIQISRTIPLQFKSRRDDRLVSDVFDVDGFGRQSRGNSTFRGTMEGGMGGRNVGGEWQVQLPDAARDPREVMREQRIAAGELEDIGKTAGLEFRPEEYPALGSDSADNNPLWVGKKGIQRTNNEDFPALSSAGSRGPVIPGWGGNVTVKKKLTVMKSKGAVQSHTSNKSAKGSVVGFHPPPPPPSTIEKKMTKQPPIPKPIPITQSESEELTLAEKIKKEMTLKANPSPTPVQREATPTLKVEAIPKTAQNPSPPLPKDSPDDYPALPTKREKKTVTPASNSLVASSKSGKTSSGIYLVKPKSKGNQSSSTGEVKNAIDPPPGFVLLDNEPPPGFFSSTVSESKPNSGTVAPTEVSSRKDFPGSWVSIGGSRGVQTKVDTNSVSLVSDNDFPTLPGGKTVPTLNQKKSKSKKQVQNELQNLAFKTK